MKLTNLKLPSRPIPAGGKSGSPTRIAMTESILLFERDEKLAAFVELESAIRTCGELA